MGLTKASPFFCSASSPTTCILSMFFALSFDLSRNSRFCGVYVVST